ncbi:MAG: lytic murein transglycosylase [Patescibacteria group bacterium]
MRTIIDIKKRPGFSYSSSENKSSSQSDNLILRLRQKTSVNPGLIKALAGFFVGLGLLSSQIGFVSAPISVSFADTLDALEARRELEQKLSEIESQIQGYENTIQGIQGEKKTLANEIKILDSTIAKLNLQIKAIDLEIQRLNLRINDLSLGIKDSESRIDKQRTLLADSLKALYESDQLSLLEVLVSRNSLSEFFDEINAQTAIQVEVQKDLNLIKELKVSLEGQRTSWIDRREDQAALLRLQEAQKSQLAGKKAEKDKLLAATKGKEAAYQKLLKESEKTAAEIRAQLYRLIGGGEIKFGDALKYAEFAYQQTGVRPALLLAVLDKESALGKNVGRCNWETAMHPTRDKPAFLQITQELGLDPDSVPVSCPILSDGAYGGAMGIAQFIPSTWMIYKDRIQKITGTMPSPWNPRDAFLATSLYLSDAGASNANYTNERIAAAKYYAGGRWRYYLYSYGDRVMELARYYENQIQILKQAGVDNFYFSLFF